MGAELAAKEPFAHERTTRHLCTPAQEHSQVGGGRTLHDGSGDDTKRLLGSRSTGHERARARACERDIIISVLRARLGPNKNVPLTTPPPIFI